MNIEFRYSKVSDAESISVCIQSSPELQQGTEGSREGIDDGNDMSGEKRLFNE